MDDLKPVTHLLAVDITSGSGIKLLRQGLNYLVKYYFAFLLNIILPFSLMPVMSWGVGPTYSVLLFFFYMYIMLQIEGSKDARVGLLFSGNQTTNLFSLLFVKVFEITTSSYRFVL
jgi:UDP-glucose:glycoprotein glucosyltransferase